MYGSQRISQGRSFAEKFYDDTTPYSPYIIIKYQFVPQDTVGEYLQSKTHINTWRGTLSYSEWTQKIGTVKGAEAYRNFVEKSDRELESLTTRTSLNTLHDTYTVVVGVIDKAILHSGPGGENVISYEDLFRFLAALGFDPLAPIRRSQKEYIDALGEIVRKEIVNGDFNKDSIKSHIMSGLGNKMVYAVQEYIFGGRKPKLATATTEEYRPEKAKRYPGLYQGAKGMNEALFETGELHEAIECNVFSSQSPMMKSYLKELRDSIRNTVKWRKKHAEKVLVEARKEEALQRGIEKYKKEMQRQSRKLGAKSEFEMDELRREALRMIRNARPSQRKAMIETYESVFGEHGTKAIPKSTIESTIRNVKEHKTGGKRLVGTRHLAPFAFFSMPKTAAEIEKYTSKILGAFTTKTTRTRRSARIIPVPEIYAGGTVNFEARGASKTASQWTTMDVGVDRIRQLQNIVDSYDNMASSTQDAFKIRKYMMEKKLVDADIDFARFTLDVLRRNGII